jgi:hypothetical protein
VNVFFCEREVAWSNLNRRGVRSRKRKDLKGREVQLLTGQLSKSLRHPLSTISSMSDSSMIGVGERVESWGDIGLGVGVLCFDFVRDREGLEEVECEGVSLPEAEEDADREMLPVIEALKLALGLAVADKLVEGVSEGEVEPEAVTLVVTLEEGVSEFEEEPEGVTLVVWLEEALKEHDGDIE